MNKNISGAEFNINKKKIGKYHVRLSFCVMQQDQSKNNCHKWKKQLSVI